MSKKPEIKYTQAFSGVIRDTPNGRKLILASPKWYSSQLSKFRDGEKVSLMVHNKKPKRSDAQNRYLWGVYYPLVSEATGEADIDKMHMVFRKRFLTVGIAEVLGEKVRVMKSSTELSKQEFYEFIMAIANDTGVQPPPTENSWYELSTERVKQAPVKVV